MKYNTRIAGKATTENTQPQQRRQLTACAEEADVSKGRYAASSKLTAAPPPSMCPINHADPSSTFQSPSLLYAASVKARMMRWLSAWTLTV